MNEGAEQLHGSGEVARIVNLPVWKLLYLIGRGLLPGPSYEVPGRRLYTDADVEAITKVLAGRPELRSGGGQPTGGSE
jgi:DNA-binding transcriptional MerR regulator